MVYLYLALFSIEPVTQAIKGVIHVAPTVDGIFVAVDEDHDDLIDIYLFAQTDSNKLVTHIETMKGKIVISDHWFALTSDSMSLGFTIDTNIDMMSEAKTIIVGQGLTIANTAAEQFLVGDFYAFAVQSQELSPDNDCDAGGSGSTTCRVGGCHEYPSSCGTSCASGYYSCCYCLPKGPARCNCRPQGGGGPL